MPDFTYTKKGSHPLRDESTRDTTQIALRPSLNSYNGHTRKTLRLHLRSGRMTEHWQLAPPVASLKMWGNSFSIIANLQYLYTSILNRHMYILYTHYKWISPKVQEKFFASLSIPETTFNCILIKFLTQHTAHTELRKYINNKRVPICTITKAPTFRLTLSS